MNTSRLYPVIFLLLVLGLTIGYFFSASKSNVVLMNDQKKSFDLLDLEMINGKLVRVLETQKNYFRTVAYDKPTDADIAAREKQIYEVSKAMHRDLDYYVKVVDNHGEPITGVEVFLTSRGFSYLGPVVTGRTENRTAFTTDEQGLVHLKANSVSFYLEFRKEGYAFESIGDELNESNKRSSIIGTASHPRVIHGHKLPDQKSGERGRPEYMGSIYRFVPDGSALAVNLETKNLHKGSQTDLMVHMTRRLSPVPNRDEYIAWEVSISVPDGGILETNDSIVVEAPQAGYVKNWSLTNSLDASKARKTNMLTRNFYVKARGGKFFAYVSITFNPINGGRTDQAYIDISGIINKKSGSRYLYRGN